MTKLETADPHHGRLVANVEARLVVNALERNRLRIVFEPATGPTVSIVIVSFNARDMLALTLYRLACQQTFAGAAFEVILVDNASDLRTQALLDRLDGVTVIRNAENIGFGPACNQGASAALGRYVLFLNPDVELMPGALGALLEPFADANVGIVGAHLVFPGGYLQECGAFFRDDAQVTHPYGRGDTDPLKPEGAFQRDVGYVSGAVLMIDRALFEELDGFDDIFTPAYFEDTDLCVRCHQKGRRVVYQPRATAIHFENATSPKQAQVATLIDRNRQRFLDRHRSWLFPGGATPQRFGDRDHDRWALRILYIDDAVPHVDQGAGMPRANFVIGTMVGLGYRVTVYPAHNADAEIAQRYRDLPDTVEILDANEAEGLSRLIDQRRDYYDVIWVSRPHNIDLVCQVVQDRGISLRDFIRKRVIFDTEALFCVRDFLETTLRAGQGLSSTLQRLGRRETRNFSQADHVVCVSDAEVRILKSFGVDNARTLGHAFNMPEGPCPGFEERNGFLFVGSLEHDLSPNTDSLNWFLDAVWPQLRRDLPDVPFSVAGPITTTIRERLESAGVEVLGRVADLTPFLNRTRVFVAPTRYAAGVPHKVHMAISHGLPCFVTTILAEQIGWPEDTGYLECDWRDAAGFAAGLVRLHREPERWARLQRVGLQKAIEDCAPSVYAAMVQQLCEAPTFA